MPASRTGPATTPRSGRRTPGNPRVPPAAGTGAWPKGKGYSDPLNDLPPFEGTPRTWVVASSQRCGGTLLCDLLASVTGRLGVPAEYLNFDVLGRQMLERFGMPPPQSRPPIDAYLDRLYRCRTSAEGFFGLRLQWYQYAGVHRSAEVARLMRGSPIIRLTRRDIVAQSISSAMANASGYWHERGGSRARPAVPYNQKTMDRAVQWVLWENWQWDQFFRLNGIGTLDVVYEDLLADADGVCRKICDYIGLENPPRFDLAQAPIREMPRARGEEWHRGFEKQIRLGPSGDVPGDD